MKNCPKIIKFHLGEATLFCHKKTVALCMYLLLSADRFALGSSPYGPDAPRPYCLLCPTI